MKNLCLLIVLCVSFLSVSCSSEQKKAERVAKKFLNAYYVSFDFDLCLKVSSTSSSAAIENKRRMISLNPLAKEDPPKIIVQNVVVDKGSEAYLAQCIYTINGVSQSLSLLKINGEWLVDVVSSDVDTFSVFGGGSGGFAVGTSIPRSVLRKQRDSATRVDSSQQKR
ncbi:MAG: hypothetical protein LBQ31_05705 [Bacteroidales bacterium]|jgi:hypothetical protein|nr:hypothetical protein [Bacteroidales bacterium]